MELLSEKDVLYERLIIKYTVFETPCFIFLGKIP